MAKPLPLTKSSAFCLPSVSEGRQARPGEKKFEKGIDKTPTPCYNKVSNEGGRNNG